METFIKTNLLIGYMPICTLVEMNKALGLVAQIESSSIESAFADLSRWLSDFYVRERKTLDVSDYLSAQQWRHKVLSEGEVVSHVNVNYFGQNERTEVGRRVASKRFGVYFDFPDGRPNVLDKNGFKKYFDTRILDQSTRYPRTA